MQLNEKLHAHFYHPRHQGCFSADVEHVVTASLESKATGRMLVLQLKVSDGRIEDVRFKAHGCPYTIATASYLAEQCVGRTLEEAQKMNREQLAKELDLPTARYHCAVMAEDALKTAINQMRIKP